MAHSRDLLIVAVFAAVYGALGVYSFARSSATWDEPIHLTAGYAAAARQDFRVDPSHPPLLRMWAALPSVLDDEVRAQPIAEGRFAPQWLSDAYAYAHRFLYADNDADRLLYRGRFMTLLLGIALGVLVFAWTREWLGRGAAIIALVCYSLEPNLLAHATLVTTDLGVTCFIFGAVYFLWRTCQRVTAADMAALCVCVAAAIVSKFTALLLAPLVIVMLAEAVRRRDGLTLRTGALIAVAIAATSYAAIWTVYGFRYLPSAATLWVFDFTHSAPGAGPPALAAAVRWIDGHHLLPNAFIQGVFHAAVTSPQLPSFLMGRNSPDGWWYYFPAALALKTPLVLLGLSGAGVVVCLARRHQPGGAGPLFLLFPATAFLGVAMWSGVNIGLRHVLPVYPFLVMLAAAGAYQLWQLRPRTAAIASGALAVLLVAEQASAYPHPLTFFNQLAGGPRNGYRYLDDSNLGWGQELKPLKAWMDAHGVRHVNLAYFGQAEPRYYGIDCTHLPLAPTFALDLIARPRLPGYVAISSVILNGIYATPMWRLFYRPFHDLEPAAVIGNSMRVYWVDRWPDAMPGATSDDADAHRALGDALLFGLRWPAQAAEHYREYLTLRPVEARDYLQQIDRILPAQVNR